jgi:hypothetical protein
MDTGSDQNADVILITGLESRSRRMIHYEVTLQVEPRLAAAVEEHMRKDHIPEIFATGCFSRIRFSLASTNRFRATYQADGQADLDRYLREHAPRLRAEFQTRFPQGVTLTRETWVQREIWS